MGVRDARLHRAVGDAHGGAEFERNFAQGQVARRGVGATGLRGVLAESVGAVGDDGDGFGEQLRLGGLGGGDLSPGIEHAVDEGVENGPLAVCLM